MEEPSVFTLSNKRIMSEKLKRARTYAGSSSMVNPMRDLGLYNYPNDQKVFSSKYDSNSVKYQDENVGGNHQLNSSFIHQPQPIKITGLQPRFINSDEQRSFNRESLASTMELSNDPKSPISYSTLINTTGHLLTLKNDDNVSTDEFINLDEKNNDSNYTFNKHSKYTKVDIEIPKVQLADSDEPLDLSSISNKFLTDTSPFYQTREFNPVDTTDTGILLKILNYEFESIPDESDIDDDNDNVDDYLDENSQNIVPWYRNILNFNFFRSVIDANKVLSKDEYNEKFPWDKFYEPELFEFPETDDINVLNEDMIPRSYHDTIASSTDFSKKQYNYVSTRRKPNTEI